MVFSPSHRVGPWNRGAQKKDGVGKKSAKSSAGPVVHARRRKAEATAANLYFATICLDQPIRFDWMMAACNAIDTSISCCSPKQEVAGDSVWAVLRYISLVYFVSLHGLICCIKSMPSSLLEFFFTCLMEIFVTYSYSQAQQHFSQMTRYPSYFYVHIRKSAALAGENTQSFFEGGNSILPTAHASMATG
jgi:hypothetical protein